jgi:hypothetical protein
VVDLLQTVSIDNDTLPPSGVFGQDEPAAAREAVLTV